MFSTLTMAVQARMAITIKTNDSPGKHVEKEKSTALLVNLRCGRMEGPSKAESLNRGQERRLSS